MTIAVVPNRDVAMGNAHVISASSVQAVDWASASAAYNALDGMGSALIPMCAPICSITGAISFTVWPRYQCTHRLWIISAALDGSSDDAPSSQCTFTDPSGGTEVFNVASTSKPATNLDAPLVVHVETVSARTSAETVLSPTFAFSVGSGLLYAIGCYELPRVSLAVAGSAIATSDAGMNAAIAASGFPIDDDYAGNGIGFIGRELDALRDAARRTGLFAAAPFLSTTSGTFATVLTAPVVTGRSLYNGQTQSIMQLAANATCMAGAQGEVRVTMASGAVVTIPLTGSGNFRGQIAIDCEDMTTTDGRRSSRDETVTVELRRTSASGTVTLNTINGGEGTAASVVAARGIAPSIPIRTRFGKGPLPHWMSGGKNKPR